MPTNHDQSHAPSASSPSLSHEQVIRAYRRYGRLYNLVFGASMAPGRRATFKIMNCQPDDHVLEVGVGSGLALPYYPPQTKVTGIDLSPDMLRQAESVVAKNNLRNVELKRMDCQQMEFPDNSFSKVAIMYVAAVVPDARAMMAETRRVCQPDGDVLVLNHFASQHPVVRRMEKGVSTLSKLVGFTADVNMDDFVERSQMELQSIKRVNAFGYWKLLHFKNRPPCREQDNSPAGTPLPASGPDASPAQAAASERKGEVENS